MDLVDSVEAGKLTLSELIDTLAKDKNYAASKWDREYISIIEPAYILGSILTSMLMWGNSD